MVVTTDRPPCAAPTHTPHSAAATNVYSRDFDSRGTGDRSCP